MPLKKKTYKRKVAPRRKFRSTISRQIQLPDLKPPSAMVRYEGKQRYLAVSNTPGTNGKSILRIPCSFMGNPSIVSGAWQAQSTDDIIDTTANFFSKYNHYVVLGMRVDVACKNASEPGALDQNACIMCIARTPDQSVYSSSSPLKTIEGAYGVKSTGWGTLAGSGYRQARAKIGYSPRKQLAIKDPMDNATLKCATVYGQGAGENTFVNVILSGLLDQASLNHADAIVDVKVSYLVKLFESTVENAPTL